MRLVDSRKARYLVGAGMLTALLTGCGGRSTVVLDAAQLGVAPTPGPRLTLNPPDGAAGVSPTEKVTAAVIGGQLTGVLLAGPDGKPVAGQLSPDGERWSSNLPLKAGTAYTLKAGSRAPSGEETSTVARFRTLAPGQDVTGRITPDDAGPVPVDQVVSVVFEKPIVNREAVERALRVSANPAASGKTQWKSDRELIWRPASEWAPGSQVTVSLDIYGKQLGGNLVGAADLRRSFRVVGEARDLALRAANSSAAPSAGNAPSGSGPSAGAAPSRRSDPAGGAGRAPSGATTFGVPGSGPAASTRGSGGSSAVPARPSTQPPAPSARSRTVAPSATPEPGTRPSSAPKPSTSRSSSGSSSSSAVPAR